MNNPGVNEECPNKRTSVSASGIDCIIFSITVFKFLDKFYIYDILKTRTKVVHKNVTQGCNFSKSCNIKVALCDL